MNGPVDRIRAAADRVSSDQPLGVANVSRRRFLQGISAMGGLVLAVGIPSTVRAADPPKYGADGMPHGWIDDPLAFVAIAEDFERAGVPIAGRLEQTEWAEGGDCCWLDKRTLLAGCGYRTNEAGITRLRELLPGVEVLAFDLPHWRGRGEVMHLMSLISPLAADLAVVYPPLLPARLAQLLEQRDVKLVEVPDEEFDSMAANVLALAPRVALAVDGNPETRRRMERAGVDVLVYEGAELSKGDGGPTCLTRPLLRA